MGQKSSNSGLDGNKIGARDVWFEGARQPGAKRLLVWLLGEGIQRPFGWEPNGEAPVDAEPAKVQFAALVCSAVAPPTAAAPTPGITDEDGQKSRKPQGSSFLTPRMDKLLYHAP